MQKFSLLTNSKLLSAACLGMIFFMSSCSNEMVSSLSSNKHLLTTTQATEKPIVSNVAPQPVAPQMVEGVKEVSTPIAVAPIAAPETKSQKPASGNDLKTKINSFGAVKMAKDLKEKEFKSISYASTVVKAKKKAALEGNLRTAIILIVVGLIVIAVGGVLANPIAGIFYLIGSIFVIVGLIFLLLWALDNA